MDRTKLGCVYTITCNVNNKIYVGQTIDFNRRVWKHLYNLRNKKHKNRYLQNDYNKYGEHNFSIKCVKEDLSLEARRSLETSLIQSFGGIESDNVYNFQDNITENKEMRELVSKHQIGKNISPQSIIKMKKTLTGRSLSEEHKAKIKRSAQKFCGENNPAKRPEVRQRISEAVSGTGNDMYNKRKYDQNIIKQLRQEYESEHITYKALSSKYHIPYATVSYLIRFGETFDPNTYYKNRKFKDYPNKE